MSEQIELNEDIKEYLEMCKSSLLIMSNFLDRAVGMLELKEVSDIGCVCTDGVYIYYDSKYIVKRLQDETPLERDFIHMALHLIFGHAFDSLRRDIRLWDLACDIVVEDTIMTSNFIELKSRKDELLTLEIEGLKRQVNVFTAQRLYKYLDNNRLKEESLAKLEKLFKRDEHYLWYQRPSTDEDEIDSDDYKGVHLIKGRRDFKKSLDDRRLEDERQKLKHDWELVSKHIELDGELKESEGGDGYGSLIQNIKSVKKDKLDYSSFLADFASLGEEMLVNDEEFDYIYYNYGLSIYDNIPLIEPLEYKSEKRIREFAIILDTSGSCTGEIVQGFLEKTYSILLSDEAFSNKVNIHLIQCDSEIQQDYKIQNIDELEGFMKNQKLTGFGGTDFRPAFKYIDRLVENKEFENLQGILYFTDGYGTYPTEVPSYKTVFVFVDTGVATPNVPSWAMKILIEEDDLVIRE